MFGTCGYGCDRAILMCSRPGVLFCVPCRTAGHWLRGTPSQAGSGVDHVVLLAETVRRYPSKPAFPAPVSRVHRNARTWVGTGPRGSYIRVGTHGLYYQQTLSRPVRRDWTVPSPASAAATATWVGGLGGADEDVTGATTLEFADSPPSELVNQVNEYMGTSNRAEGLWCRLSV